MVTCRECGKEFKFISYTHLQRHRLSYDEYRKSYGLEIQDLYSVSSRHNRATREDYVPLTKDDIVQEIHRIFLSNGDVSCAKVNAVNRQAISQAMSLWGSWDAALREAGLRPIDFRRHETWSEEKVISELKNLYAAQGRFPPCEEFKKIHCRLFDACYRYFGGLSEAYRAAGFDPVRLGIKQKGLSAEEAMTILKAAKSIRELSPYEYGRVRKAASRYWGSFRNAVIVADHDPDTFYAVVAWSKEKVIERILEISAQCKGRDEFNKKIKAEDNNIKQAAIKHFGAFSKALLAANIKPQRIWRRIHVDSSSRLRELG